MPQVPAQLVTHSVEGGRLRPSLGFVLLALFLVGCSGEATSSTDRFGSGPDLSDTTVNARRPTSPLAFVLEDRSDFQKTLETAWNGFAVACAADVGVDYRPASIADVPSAGDGMDGLLGITEMDRARRTGYIVDTSGTDPGDIGDPINELSSDERAALETAFNGPQSSRTSTEVRDNEGNLVGGYELGSGCLADFYASFFGSLDAFGSFMASDLRLQDALNRSRDLLTADPAYRAAQDNWSACMQRAGYRYSTPFDPLSQSWAAPRPSDDEVRAATSDVRCKDETSLVEIATRSRELIEQRLLEELDLSNDAQLVSRQFGLKPD